MRYRVVHQTQYRYSAPVSLCHNEARVTPRTAAHQICQRSQLVVEPSPAVLRERDDFFGNHVSYFAIQQLHDHMTVIATSEVQTTPVTSLPDLTLYGPWERLRDHYQRADDPDVLEVRPYILDSLLVAATPALAGYAAASFPIGRPVLEAVRDLMQRIHQEFDYVPGFTAVTTPLASVLKQRRGVCQDFAHLAIGCLRAMGLAGRYVSGYLETMPPPGQERLVGADASHAWFSIYVPGGGWIDFDPTNNRMPTDRHITVAWGRDYADVAPLKGVIFGGGEHQLSVSVDVAALAT